MVLNNISLINGERKKLILQNEFESDNFDLVDYYQDTDTALITLKNFNRSGSIGLIKGVYKQFEKDIKFAKIFMEECKKSIKEEKFENQDGVICYLWSQIKSDIP